MPFSSLLLVQMLVCLSLKWWISPSVFAMYPGGSKTKTSFGSEGPTKELMFTIIIHDYFVLPDFHYGCTQVSVVSCSITSMLVSAERGLGSSVHPSTLFFLMCNRTITAGSCFAEADWEVHLAFSVYKPLSLHAAAAVVLLLMYAQGSFVSKYTLHGLYKRIFLHYYGDLNCLWEGSFVFC